MNKKLFRELKESIKQMGDIKLGKIKARRTWLINPVTRIKPSKKRYCRALSKKDVKDILKQEDF